MVLILMKVVTTYWVGSLIHVDPSKREADYEVLLGFSESPENCELFTDITGIT